MRANTHVPGESLGTLCTFWSRGEKKCLGFLGATYSRVGKIPGLLCRDVWWKFKEE